MIIVNFEKQHIDAAKALALANYQEESSHVPELPASPVIPDLDWFAENGPGVAAMEDDRLVGFLCWVGPFENAFNSGIRDGFPQFAPAGDSGKTGYRYPVFRCAGKTDGEGCSDRRFRVSAGSPDTDE